MVVIVLVILLVLSVSVVVVPVAAVEVEAVRDEGQLVDKLELAVALEKLKLPAEP